MLLDLAACEPPRDVIVIEERDNTLSEETLDLLLSPFQPLREQIAAITGLGLDDEKANDGREISQHRIDVDGMNLSVSYLVGGNPSGQRVVFIHGSPGRGDEWAKLFTDIPAGQQRIAVDRPGFGETLPEEPVVSLSEQARALGPLIDPGDGRKTILVGYSYGGPVALRAALEMPHAVSGLLLVGSAADPEQEDVHPLQTLVGMEIFAQLLPTELANANAELLTLRSELETLSGELVELEIPVTIVHGLRDSLVPVENAVYLHEMLAKTVPVRVVLVEEGDHFLPWTHPEALDEALACLIKDAQLTAVRG